MAAYARDFVVSIIGPNGQPLREKSDDGNRTVSLPFDSEYRVRLINKNIVRAKVEISIDGMDVMPGRTLILAPNQTLDLERFVLDGDLQKGNRFKFVSLAKGQGTGEVQDPTSQENGRISVKFYKERTWYDWAFNSGGITFATNSTFTSTGANVGPLQSTPYPSVNPPLGPTLNGSTGQGSVLSCTNASSGSIGQASSGPSAAFYASASGAILPSKPVETPEELKGATALGGESKQQFHDTHENFSTHDATQIDIYLRGQVEAPKPVLPTFEYIVKDSNGDVVPLVLAMKFVSFGTQTKSEVERILNGKHVKETWLVQSFQHGAQACHVQLAHTVSR